MTLPDRTAILCPSCWRGNDKSWVGPGEWRPAKVGDPCQECGTPLVLVAPVKDRP